MGRRTLGLLVALDHLDHIRVGKRNVSVKLYDVYEPLVSTDSQCYFSYPPAWCWSGSRSYQPR